MVTFSPALRLETTPATVEGVPATTIGAEAPSVSDGGGPLTVIRPLSDGLIASWYAKRPAVRNVNEYVLPGARIGEANEPSSATTWWFVVSAFLQVTVSPKSIVTELGEKPDFVILTVVVAAPAGDAVASTPSPASTTSSLRIFFPLRCDCRDRRAGTGEFCFRDVKRARRRL